MSGTPMSQGNLRSRVLVPAAQEAGVPWAGFHALRHSCASRLIASGRNIVQVSRWLGHHSPAFTLNTYAHLMDDGVGDALPLPVTTGKTTSAAFGGAGVQDATTLDSAQESQLPSAA
jgi:hypothetical protein